MNFDNFLEEKCRLHHFQQVYSLYYSKFLFSSAKVLQLPVCEFSVASYQKPITLQVNELTCNTLNINAMFLTPQWKWIL